MRRLGPATWVGSGLLLMISWAAPAQESTSVPASRPRSNSPIPAEPAVPTTRAAPDQQRLDDLAALVEGQKVPLAQRRTGARELLRLDWPETTARVAAILAGRNGAAKTAVALALADVPQFLKDIYVDPLMIMLGDSDAEARQAAATALAAYRNGGVTPRLREIMLDDSQPMARRLAAIDALGLTTRREAAAALVEALANPGSPICQPALTAFEQVTSKSFHGVPEQAQAWWAENEKLSPLEWQQAQIDRLIQKERESTRRLHELEARLVESFREDYVRAPETDRPALLQSFLADSSAALRMLGLDLVQRHQGEGKKLAPELAVQVRALLTDAEPEVRAAAAQAVARLRDASDTDRFIELLAGERNTRVRLALVNGLGYIGTDAAAEPLLGLLRSPDGACVTEAVAALGRLAERDVLTGHERTAVADALLEVFQQTAVTQSGLREQLLWAMSLVGDPRFAKVFVAALADSEAPAVRQAAVRGLATLKDPQLLNAMLPLLRDPDAALRRTVAEVLADLGSRDDQLTALWARLDPAQESEDAIRRTAWRGVVRMLSGRKAAELDGWIRRLPADDADRAGHTVELLRLMESSLTSQPEARGELGAVRARIAAERAATVPPDETVAAYLTALADLHAGQSPEIPRVCLDLFRFALLNGRYDETIAAALANCNPPLDGETIWQAVRGEIEQRLTREKVDHAIAMLEALEQRPPGAFSQEVTDTIAQLLSRARQIKASPSASSEPGSQAAGPAE